MIARPVVRASMTIFATTILSAPILAAEPFAEQRSVSVKYEDLDLTKPRGMAALTARIAHAAAMACGPVDFRNLQDLDLFQACRSAAIQATTTQVRSAIAVAHQSQYAARSAKATGTN